MCGWIVRTGCFQTLYLSSLQRKRVSLSISHHLVIDHLCFHSCFSTEPSCNLQSNNFILHSCFRSVEHGCQEQTCPPPTEVVPWKQCEGAAVWLAERIGHRQLDHSNRTTSDVCLRPCLIKLLVFPCWTRTLGDLVLPSDGPSSTL